MSQKDVFIVVGASGLLGRDVVVQLLARGDTVFGLDIVQRHHDIPFFSADITQQDQVEAALKNSGATCIIHTASPIAGLRNTALYWKVNVEGTKTVIAAAVAMGVRKLVYTSSAGVAYSGGDLVNADETQPFPAVPFDEYTASKTEAEKIVLAANGKEGLLTVALRPSSIFGPNDHQATPGFYNAWKTGKSHIQIGNNENLYDYTYVGNVAYAHLLAADKLPTTPGPGDTPSGEVAGQAFFITNGEPMPFWTFARTMWDHFDRLWPGQRVPKRRIVISRPIAMILGTVNEWFWWLVGAEPLLTRGRMALSCSTRYYNIGKARRVLGYEPQVTLEEGLRRTCDAWYEEVTSGGAPIKT